jgi:DNA replication and repair protein RecF
VVISSLRTAAFRNLEDATVGTAAKNIFLIGGNGQGKTNFLEALYFCAYGSSFRGVSDGEIARNSDSQNRRKDFSAAVSATDGKTSADVLIKVENGKKTVSLNGKKAEDRKELLSVVPCVVFCHEDMEFVAGSPERRRWFFDQALSLYDPVYLDDFRRYRRVLKSRNSILRDHAMNRLDGNSGPLLDVLDQQCALYGTRLMEKRGTAARLFSDIFADLYLAVAGVPGMAVQYLPSWKSPAGDCAGEAAVDAAAGLLQKRRAADLAAGASLSGPHRDRYVFAVGSGGSAVGGAGAVGVEFAGSASTGQRRLLALLLRVAQARRFFENTGRKPVLLLDDVLLEMDGEKRRRFLSALPDYDQAFYTFLPEEPYQHYCAAGDTLVYRVENGRVTQ